MGGGPTMSSSADVNTLVAIALSTSAPAEEFKVTHEEPVTTAEKSLTEVTEVNGRADKLHRQLKL